MSYYFPQVRLFVRCEGSRRAAAYMKRWRGEGRSHARRQLVEAGPRAWRGEGDVERAAVLPHSEASVPPCA
jgi:hypothetical protein